jgi:hypothetical protein
MPAPALSGGAAHAALGVGVSPMLRKLSPLTRDPSARGVGDAPVPAHTPTASASAAAAAAAAAARKESVVNPLAAVANAARGDAPTPASEGGLSTESRSGRGTPRRLTVAEKKPQMRKALVAWARSQLPADHMKAVKARKAGLDVGSVVSAATGRVYTSGKPVEGGIAARLAAKAWKKKAEDSSHGQHIDLTSVAGIPLRDLLQALYKRKRDKVIVESVVFLAWAVSAAAPRAGCSQHA